MKIHVNTSHPLPKKGRKASTDKAALIEEIKRFSKPIEMQAIVESIDFERDSKIDFDFENVLLGWNHAAYGPFCSSSVIETLLVDGKDIPFIKGCAGGDWENPVAFIIYLSNKGELRMYVPRKGNVFNRDTREAFGNDDDADEAFLKKEGIRYKDFCDHMDEVEFDEAALLEDIAARLIPC